MSSILFLDIDDVLCLNNKYGGRDLLTREPPADLYEHLFSKRAVAILKSVIDEYQPWVVISSTWREYFDRDQITEVLFRTGLGSINLHEHWSTPRIRVPNGVARRDQIRGWLSRYHRGEPFVVLDDHYSGSGLKGWHHHRDGRVILCTVNKGLTSRHLATMRTALGSPLGLSK